MPPKSRSLDTGSRAVERVSQVIQFLSSSPRRGQAVPDVAKHLGISRQAASRLLDGMVKGGIASKDSTTRRYRLSMQPFIWFRRVAMERAPNDVIRNEMISIAGEINALVTYAILDGPLALGLEQAECTDAYAILRPSTGFGPWESTVTGKTLVAFSAPEIIQEYLHADRQQSKAELTRLEKELETIKKEGMLRDDGETFRLAVPIKDSDDLAYATFLAIPRQKNLTDEEKQRFTSVVVQGAARCSASIGPDDTLTI